MFKALVDQAPERVDVRLELAAAEIQHREWGTAYSILQNIKAIDGENAARLFTLLAYAQLNLHAPEQAKASVDRLAQYAKTDRDRQELDYLRSIVSKDLAAQPAPAAPPALTRKSDEISETSGSEERPTIRRSPALIERSLTTTPSPLPSVTGKFLELRCMGERALIILDTGESKKTFLIADAQKIQVSGAAGGTADLNCGSQPRTPLRVEYSRSDAPQVDGEVRALCFEK